MVYRRSKLFFAISVFSILLHLPAFAAVAAPPESYLLSRSFGVPPAPASLDTPSGVAVGDDGKIYVVDTGHNRVLKFTAEGDFAGSWGRYGSGNADLISPRGVTVGSNGEVYVVDAGNARIVAFSSDGTYLRQWHLESNPTPPTQVSEYVAVAVDPLGNLYVADRRRNQVQKLAEDGTVISSWSMAGTSSFSSPAGVALDHSGNIYVADTGNGRVVKLDPFGNKLESIPNLSAPAALFIDAGDYLYIACSNGIYRRKAGGTPEKIVLSGSGDAAVSAPLALAVEADGTLTVADTGNGRIERIAADGTFLKQWGAAPPLDGELKGPAAVGRDGEGNMYVLDAGHNRVQKFAPNGAFLLSWGSAGNGDGQFMNPQDIGVTADGTVLVADTGNNRIQKFTPDGTFLRAWNASSASDPDRKLNRPTRIAVSTKGVYVLDRVKYYYESFYRSRVRRFSTDGYLFKSGSFKAGPLTTDGTGSLYTATTTSGEPGKMTVKVTMQGIDGKETGRVILKNAPGTVAAMAYALPGYLYVRFSSNEIWKTDLKGRVYASWGGTGTDDALFEGIGGIADGVDGSVLVADGGNARMKEFVPVPPEGGCAYSVFPLQVSFPSKGGRAVVSVTAPPGCAWTYGAIDWGSVSSAVTGPGQGKVTIVADRNDSPHERTGSIKIAGENVSLVQKGTPCSIVYNETYAASTVFDGAGGASEIFIAVEPWGCTWTVSPGADWLTVVSANNDDGGAVLSAAENITGKPRTGTVTVQSGSGKKVLAMRQLATREGYEQKGAWGGERNLPGQFVGPSGVAVGPNDVVYVSDTGNHRVQKFDSSGNFLLSWSGTAEEPLAAPASLAVAPSGDVYVLDSGSVRIRRYAPDGSFLGAWGESGQEPGQFSNPSGIAVGPEGKVYVCDRNKQRVEVFTAEGSYLTGWTTVGIDGKPVHPEALAVDGAGALYAAYSATSGLDKTVKYSSSGTVLVQGGKAGTAIAVASGGTIYLADGNSTISKLDAALQVVANWNSSGSAPGQFAQPSGVAVDAAGRLYVADKGNNRIQVFAANGNLVGGWGIRPPIGELDGAVSVALSPAGDLYVVERTANRVQKFTREGEAVSLFGKSGSEPGEFRQPTGIAVASSGEILVADTGNNRIQVFDASGAYLWEFSDPDHLVSPTCVAVAPTGEIYVVAGNRLERFDSSGKYSATLFSGYYSDLSHEKDVQVGVVAAGGDGSIFGSVNKWSYSLVKKFNPQGKQVLQWGGNGYSMGKMSGICGIAVDAGANVYVADCGNGLMEKFDPKGKFLTKVDGTPQEGYPVGVAVTPDGNELFVITSQNYLVRHMKK